MTYKSNIKKTQVYAIIVFNLDILSNKYESLKS